MNADSRKTMNWKAELPVNSHDDMIRSEGSMESQQRLTTGRKETRAKLLQRKKKKKRVFSSVISISNKALYTVSFLRER